jgi:hypothetical protein
MHRLVAAGGPAGAFLDAEGVIGPADQEGAAGLLLKVALEAKVGVPDCQQFRIDGAVGSVADRAAFADGLVLENKRPALRSQLSFSERMEVPPPRWMEP